MKVKQILLFALATIVPLLKSSAQTADSLSHQSYPIQITFNKTSSIIFPTMIASVDRGSRDILAQKARGVENVLQLKAARTDFPETNLTVITTDGVLRQFTVNYSKRPKSLSLNVTDLSNNSQASIIFDTEMTESDMLKYSARIAHSERAPRVSHQTKNRLSLSLNGIFVKDNILFFHFRIRNHSNINYDVDFLRFYVQDKGKVKRTASQEITRDPLFTYGNDKSIEGRTTSDLVYAFQKFTIPDAKRLIVELYERDGGRNLALGISNRKIVSARFVR